MNTNFKLTILAESASTTGLLTIVVSLAILFSAVGCATVTSHDGGAEGGKKTASQKEVAGKVVQVTPCRTLVELEVAKANERGETTRMQFFNLDPEARESAKDVKKGDTVKIQYVFSPETQRNRIRKITKVTR